MFETGKHIYIVADPGQTRDSLIKSLNRAYQVHLFSNVDEYLASGPYSRAACLIVGMQSSADGEVVQKLRRQNNPLPILVISDAATVAESVKLMEDGALTFLETPVNADRLCEYVEQAIDVDRRHLQIQRRWETLSTCWSTMTDRQKTVLRLIVEGMPSKSIARKNDVSQRTIEIDRSRLMTLFGVESTPELVAKATEYMVLERLGGPAGFILRKHETSFPLVGTIPSDSPKG